MTLFGVSALKVSQGQESVNVAPVCRHRCRRCRRWSPPRLLLLLLVRLLLLLLLLLLIRLLLDELLPATRISSLPCRFDLTRQDQTRQDIL